MEVIVTLKFFPGANVTRTCYKDGYKLMASIQWCNCRFLTNLSRSLINSIMSTWLHSYFGINKIAFPAVINHKWQSWRNLYKKLPEIYLYKIFYFVPRHVFVICKNKPTLWIGNIKREQITRNTINIIVIKIIIIFVVV